MNKVLVYVYVPLIEQEYNLFIPINRKIGLIKKIIVNSIIELSDANYKIDTTFDLYNKITNRVYDDDAYVIMLTPDGKTFNQKEATVLSQKKHLIFLCGHYEGFDERIKSLVDLELSLGDFVLTGGEVPAMAMVDAISRLLPDVINDESLESESFTNNLLDYPNYTKPKVYRGLEVPPILLSGNHAKIKEYRMQEQIKKTKEKRPDLITKE